MNCPICDRHGRRAFQKYTYWILECEQCHHQFCELQESEGHVESVYGDDYFTAGGAGYSNYLGENSLLIAHGERYARLLSQYMKPGRVLDVGSAAGFILKGFENEGWTGRGIEPNPGMAQYAQNQLGLAVTAGSLETFQTDERFPLITMIQVMAHFYDVRKALETAANLTEPGGYWLIESWNKDSWMARIFGQHWHEYSPPSVLHWFSPNTLEMLVEQFGFCRVAIGRPPKWLSSGHAKSLVKYKLERSGSGVGHIGATVVNLFPEKIMIPYPSYDLFWMLFKKKV